MDAQKMLNVDRDALARVCARYRVTELSLFGSAARGTLRPDSDIDLLVVFEAGALVTLFTLVDLQTELTELLGRRVDLVPKGGLKPTLKSEVLAEARILYAA
jgi:predicted nucleotidyltransferase